jgi:hypothetical protein
MRTIGFIGGFLAAAGACAVSYACFVFPPAEGVWGWRTRELNPQELAEVDRLKKTFMVPSPSDFAKGTKEEADSLVRVANRFNENVQASISAITDRAKPQKMLLQDAPDPAARIQIFLVGSASAAFGAGILAASRRPAIIASPAVRAE